MKTFANRVTHGVLPFAVLIALTYVLSAQLPENPIMFVTVMPTTLDSATQSAVFGNHLPCVPCAPRGGDLYIRYPDGTLRNLTKEAGYGNDGFQLKSSIAVREPSMHWSGTKAVFSMVIGAREDYWDTTTFKWQMYEVSGLGEYDSVRITLVPNQPYTNNVSPCYGTDDRIIFCSDHLRFGDSLATAYRDENFAMISNSGLWSLDPSTGDLQLLDHAPSGDFRPFVDSFGRVVFTRWDNLQQDQIEVQSGVLMILTHDNEHTWDPSTQDRFRQEEFPEANPRITPQGSLSSYFDPPKTGKTADTSSGADRALHDPRLPSNFFPWQINEDGTGEQTLNHIGRQDLRDTIPQAVTGDTNIVSFRDFLTSRANKSPIVNAIHMSEDPRSPGTYYAIDMATATTHSGGQIIRFNSMEPWRQSKDVTVTYITPRVTHTVTPTGAARDPWHSGFYRTPIITTDGYLLASYSDTYVGDPDIQGGALNIYSKFSYRLQTLKQSGSYYFPDHALTSGIVKRATNIDVRVSTEQVSSYFGPLWEMDPVEVVARQRPNQRSEFLDSTDAQVFNDENVDPEVFRSYLRSRDQALVVCRDVTLRDADDKLQPYYLRVEGTTHQTPNASGHIYDVAKLGFYQADYLREYYAMPPNVYGVRRVVPTRMHDAKNRPYDPDNAHTASSFAAQVETDGSVAAFVPAARAMSWQLTKNDATPVVRERYWVTFKSGEIRSCMKCHGENQEASILRQPTPSNKPLALQGLLRVWKQDNVPTSVQLLLPENNTTSAAFPLQFHWTGASAAKKYRLSIYDADNLAYDLCYQVDIDAPATSITLDQSVFQKTAHQYVWEVQALGEFMNSAPSARFLFTTDQHVDVRDDVSIPTMSLFPNPATDRLVLHTLWSNALQDPQCTIEVVNELGACVLRQPCQAIDAELSTELDVQNLPNGTYVLRLLQKQKEAHLHFVILH